MSQPPDAPAPEIVIVRRKRGGDEGHHGGVWKIAYADFMTAMMAFFLVMWLVNASNTEMKASVAAYFNPMQLTDSSARARGIDSVEPKVLKSEGDKHVTKKKPQETSTSNRNNPDGTARRKHDIQKDSNLISDPYKIAQLLGADEGPAGSKSRSRDKYTENTTAAISGRAYVDPFNPVSPLDIAPSESGIPGVPTGPSADAKNRKDDEGVAARKYGQLVSPPKSPGKGPYAAPTRPDVAGKSKTDKDNKTTASKSGTAPPNAGTTTAVPKASTAENAKAVEAKTPAQVAREKKAAKAKEIAEQRALVRAAKALSAEIKKALGKSAGAGPKIQVGTENKTIVIRLADTATFEMFSIGNSNPNPQLVELLRKLSPVITKRKERVILRGHTDSRPYRGGDFDNWRLSMARAEAAYRALRGFGVSLDRFERIEAHADRRPSVPNDPQAAGNRRIEIMLQKS